MKIAILSTGALIPHIKNMLPLLDSEAEISLFDFQDFTYLKKLYSKIEDDFDGFVLSGLAVQKVLKQYFDDKLKPTSIFDTSTEEIYYTLVQLLNNNRSIDLNKVVVDIYLLVNEKHNCQKLLDFKSVETPKKQGREFWEHISPDTLISNRDIIFNRILEKWNKGEIEHVISRNSNVMTRLKAAGIPFTFLYPSVSDINAAIYDCKNLITMEQMNNHINSIIAVVKEKQSDMLDMDVDSIKLQKVLLDYNAENMTEFQLQKTGNGFFIFTNLKTVNRITNNLNCCTLSSYLDSHLDFKTYVAYGISPDLNTARANAGLALRESIQHKSVYAMMNNSLIGPLVPNAEVLQLCPLTAEIDKVARESELSPLTIQKIKTILLLQKKQELTAGELSEKLNVKIRNTNRIIANLTKSGYVTQAGMRSTGTKGRPTRIYHFNF